MPEIKKISYTHDAMIDLIVANPTISQGDIALYFGYTAPWVSQVINSDAFRERLAGRRDDLVDPRLRMSIDDRLKGLVDKSLEVLIKKLHETENMHVAVKALDVGARALGYGAKASNGVTVNNYVALVPPKSGNAAEWLEQHQPAAARPLTIDVTPKE